MNPSKRIFPVFAKCALWVLVVGEASSGAETIARTDAHTCDQPGAFVIWVDRDRVIIKNGETYLTCRPSDGASVISDYKPPVERDVQAERAFLHSVKNTFPDTLHQSDATGTVVWKNIVPLNYRYDPLDALLAEKRLIPEADGELAIYTADGRTPGSAGRRDGAYALAFRRNGTFSVLRLDFSPHQRMPAAMVYPWQSFAGSLDPTSGRVLLFFADESLEPDATNAPGWGPFNAWWFDPRTSSLQHLVLPDGPWVKDASNFSPLRSFQTFPIGPHRYYRIKATGGRIFVRIFAYEGALTQKLTGLFVLHQNRWLRIAETADLEQVAPDGCTMAQTHAGWTEFRNVCP